MNQSEHQRTTFDPGLTQQYGGRLRRAINFDGSFNVLRRGFGFRDAGVYLRLTSMSWPKFFALLIAGFFLVNTMFATVYWLIGIENLQGAELGSIWAREQAAFFFSVHTLTTVGYGNLAPKGFVMNLAAALETMTGLFSFALGTGLMYARFARPSANIEFSRSIIVAPHQDGKALMFRIANRRPNVLMELEATVLLMTVETSEGQLKRHYAEIPVERAKVYFLPLSWTIVHQIDKTSPLWEKSAEDLRALQAEFLVLIKGFDDTFAQTVHSRRSYTMEELVWDVKFVPAFHVNDDGDLVLELQRLHAYEPAPTAPFRP
jgi:inward rectifier potassium channel